MKYLFITALMVVMGIAMPLIGHAQSGMAENIGSLQNVLDQLYNEMIPLCSQLIGVGRGIAGFAATWYIASRIWRHIANAEPVDFYPLFRPFVLGFCVLIFPSVLVLINGILKPTVSGTSAMVKNTDQAVAALLLEKEKKVKESETWKMYVGENKEGDKDRWYRYTHGNEDPSSQNVFESIGSDMQFFFEKASYNFRNTVKQWMSEILQILFQAAALCINTLRTFQLIVLAILGPLVFGLAVFDGFQHTLTSWIARYMNVFLWLPVANIFGAIIGKIQEQMLKLDLSQIQQTGDTFFSSTDLGYLVFMIIGIIGYFTVPSVANSIVNAGGAGAMLQKVTNLAVVSTSSMGNYGAQKTASAAGAIGNFRNDMGRGYEGASAEGKSGAVGTAIGRTGAYMADKLSGSPAPKE
ncbi:conjugative transposon protein TraJ [Pedobacter sp. GR22-10]|uniref:conjugative transposon protein TraJ n=1 Tax=Pedobacter sp. GR22-10 TaxID=2994472 RepID=UPI00224516C8|nr:conjugative transposon protein TraJ [Pedobacter sp. GR22-10]MCX2429921.1 conjugative transposon protein TraJ [Pedobacter sp. GR22-10]